MSKLTAQQVAQMRLDRAKGAKLRDLCRKYEISMSTASNIVRGLLWRQRAPLICPHCKHAI